MIVVKLIADAIIVMVDGNESVQDFKELVQRATNLWPDASAEIKEFADQITSSELLKEKNKKSLQDYKSQNTDQRTKQCKAHEYKYITDLRTHKINMICIYCRHTEEKLGEQNDNE